MKVRFNEELHEYRDDIGKYISVTQLLSKYKNGFAKVEQAEKYVNNHPEYPMSVEQCLYAWDFLCDFALDKGNKYHNRKELENLWLQTPLKKGYVENLDHLYNLPDNIYPELRVYNDDIRIAGHIDKVTVDGIFVDIEDYKTYKEPIKKKGFRGQTMLPPLQNLQDCNYVHAGLQLMIYGWILEGWGYRVRSLKIHHKQFDDDAPIPKQFDCPLMSEEEMRKPQIYEIKYKPQLVRTILKDYVRTNKERN